MTDPIGDLAAKLAKLERRLHAVETAPRGPFTSLSGGAIRWLTKDHIERVAIGVEYDTNEAFVRVWNADGSAKLFEASDGRVSFPPAVGPWIQNHALVEDANGRPTYAGTVNFAKMIRTTLALTTNIVDLGNMAGALSAGTCEMQVTVEAISTRVFQVSAGEVVVASLASYTGGNPFPDPITIPPTIWSPAAHPAGSIIRMAVEARITGGGGTVDLYSSGDFAHCV